MDRLNTLKKNSVREWGGELRFAWKNPEKLFGKHFNKKSGGFLLLEILLSLALLAAGAVVCFETFSLARDREQSARTRALLISCAQEKLWEMTLKISLEDSLCPDSVQSRIEEKFLKVSVNQNGKTYEERFEILL